MITGVQTASVEAELKLCAGDLLVSVHISLVLSIENTLTVSLDSACEGVFVCMQSTRVYHRK